jgi:uncharacterized protein
VTALPSSLRPLLGVVVAGALLCTAAPASADTAVSRPTTDAVTAVSVTAVTDDGVSVAGLGTVNGTPDQLRMQLRVVVVKPDATAALTASNVVAGRVRTALRQHGVAPADVQTTQLSVSPVNTGKPARRVGYQVVQGVTATLRSLGGAGQTITDVVRVGGASLRFDGVFFVISDDSPLQEQARVRAFAQARLKAEQYARLTGRALGPVLAVQEDLNYYGFDGGRFASAVSLSAGGGSYVIDPGVQRVDVRTVVRWALV